VCLVGTNPACSSSNSTIKLTLSSIIGATALVGDQFYPAINGNNLYIGLPTDVVWVGNVTGGSAGQTLTLSYTNSSANPLSNVTAVGIDGTDPANLIVYAGDDPSALGTAGAGRWFQTTQTSVAPGPPGTPLDVIATGGGPLPTATVSWSPAQVAQPLTSYTVHNSFASNGLLLPDVLVSPLAGGLFPPTSTNINVAQNVAYHSRFRPATRRVPAHCRPTAMSCLWVPQFRARQPALLQSRETRRLLSPGQLLSTPMAQL